jgi:hypothetical protein
VSLIDVVRISEGRVMEHWSVGDNLGMMQQLGVIPQPGENVEPLKGDFEVHVLAVRSDRRVKPHARHCPILRGPTRRP